jgi:hypothetical protein
MIIDPYDSCYIYFCTNNVEEVVHLHISMMDSEEYVRMRKVVMELGSESHKERIALHEQITQTIYKGKQNGTDH